jgi:phosphoribulokinase
MTSRLIPRRVFSINLLTGLLLCLGAAPVIAVEQAPDQFIQTMSNEILDMVRKDPALKAGDLQKIGLLVDTKLLTHVNFQRVPCVDTSNPFIAREIPAPDESFVVIRFANPKGIDFPYLLNMINDSFMSRANTVVVPGGKMELAMQLIFTPFVWRMIERKKKA